MTTLQGNKFTGMRDYMRGGQRAGADKTGYGIGTGKDKDRGELDGHRSDACNQHG